jgi:hypothetical protein
MHKFLLALVIDCLFHIEAFSQFNDTINYYINYTSTGIINKTNEGSSYVLNNNVKFNVYKKNISLNTSNAWIYGKQQNNLTNNDFTSVYDVSLFKSTRHIYYWALAGFDKSYSLKINYRLQSGAGIGYYAIDRKNFVLQLSDGVLYEKSDLFDTETNKLDYETLRNSFRLKFRIITGNILTVDGSDFLQHALSNRKDYIIKSTTNLSIKLRKWLSVVIALNYNKVSITQRENLLCNFGLTVDKYF